MTGFAPDIPILKFAVTQNIVLETYASELGNISVKTA
jgi:hypothetical protein